MEPVSSFYIKSSPEQFDAIVVGSGITGGWAAKELTDTRVADLIVAEKQLVEIAKALSRKARLLIMDEPTASLSAGETKKLFA
ncbi:hypothetical protein MasN3_34660 [Massilia varians]|uniref:ABC transporter domain-containing protein n=1 Tax=Massilia varians TaxID=457921 RepID=A0ABN6TCM6_9BURK|nr:hypothetical protein MasN3_34660 [Massilia varians]